MKYVYLLLDPRKKGIYSYGIYTFQYEPFYVGKGSNNRYSHHFNKRSERYNKHKFYKIKNIKEETGNFPIVKKIKCDSDIDAFELECFLIKLIGRNDLSKGPLTNLTNGGDGVSNVSEKTRLKLKSWKRTEEYKESISNTLKRKNITPKKSEEINLKISKKMKGNKNGAKKYLAISPEGNKIQIKNLKEWCRKNNFKYNDVIRVVHKREGRTQHKRWRFEKKC